jgi:serine/threonine protein kinase
MSTVYRAYDPELDRQIALKLVTAWDENDAEGPARLVREARSMAKISHPNVASVYDVGLVDDGVFIAMELIEGPTLEQWVQTTARPWTEILRMYLLAGRGLAAAHDVGLVHRDFKPDNVMVGADERPRVLDFGLARPAAFEDDELLLPDETSIQFVPPPVSRGPQTASISGSFDLRVDVTRTGIVTGTPAYMSPEQHLGELGGPASDQFAFCVSLWEALYRQRPFIGEEFFVIADAIVEGRVEPPPHNTRVPRWIHNLLLRGLAPEPEQRHPSMRSLLGSFVFSFKLMHGMA